MAFPINIVGLGNAGCRMVDSMTTMLSDNPMVAAVDTDAQTLAASQAKTRLQIGEEFTKGQGTGGDVDLGRRTAEEDRALIRALFTDSRLAMIVVGLGGGMGTGAAPIVLDAARDVGALSLCVATRPFPFEGTARVAAAESAISALVEAADAVVVIPHAKLAQAVSKENLVELFEKANEVLAVGVCGIQRLIAQPGLLNLDFSDLQKMTKMATGPCLFAYGEGKGKNKAKQALHALLTSPLLDCGKRMTGLSSILVSVTGGPDLAVQEVTSIMDTLGSEVGSGIPISMGTIIDAQWRNRLMVTLFGTEQSDSIPQVPAQRREAPPKTPPAGALPHAQHARKPAGADTQQGTLELEFYTKGQFRGIEPTVRDGEDLDIPTFVRRGISLER